MLDSILVSRAFKSNTMITEHIKKILNEIDTVLLTVSDSEVEFLVRYILSAKKIVAVGAGRVGLAIRGFAMRLGHLGLTAYMIGDATVPAIREGDLLLVSSGSGETQTIYDIIEIAKKNGATVVLITGNPDSRMGKLADSIVKINAPSKTKTVEGFTSVQPMTTLNEQCLGIFFDSVILTLMEIMGESHETMWNRHSNLE